MIFKKMRLKKTFKHVSHKSFHSLLPTTTYNMMQQLLNSEYNALDVSQENFRVHVLTYLFISYLEISRSEQQLDRPFYLGLISS